MTMTQSLQAAPTLSHEDIERLNEQFAQSHPKSILLWCLENMPQGMVQTTAFGLSGMVIMDLLYRDLNPEKRIPVLFLDTLHHFAETLELVQRSKEIYGLDLKTYQPEFAQDREAFAAQYGEALWDSDVNQFHQVTKVEPLQRAFKEQRVTSWITGRRRDQSASRSDMPIFELDSENRVKINPLANWTNRDVWKYIMENHVPYNVLHDQGYGSIGDEP